MKVSGKPMLSMCRKCARISRADLGRRYCPTTASSIRECITGPCRFFVESGKRKEASNVR